METAITPEVVGGETQILEDSPMTDAEEKELVIITTAIKTAYADKLERDLAIGAGLLKIFRRKLYRGKSGGRSWKQWLAEESAELTAGRGALGEDTAQRLRGFYQFRVELLQASATWRADGLALPSSPSHVRPLLSQLDTHPEAALEMWKAACAQAGKGKVPTFDQVNRAALAYKANEANEARRLSAAQQAAQQKAVSASVANRQESAYPPAPSVERELPPPSVAPVSAPSILAWELEKDDSALDAATECRKLHDALGAAYQAVSKLRGYLFNQTAKYGSDYLGFLRQVDAGVYSVTDIDSQVELIREDINAIADILTADVGPGELARSTLDVLAVPTR